MRHLLIGLYDHATAIILMKYLSTHYTFFVFKNFSNYT